MPRTERIRGRRGVELRRSVLCQEPLCRHCLRKGKVTAAEEVHHAVRLEDGGTYDRDNLVPLCKLCHQEETTGKKARTIGLDGWPLED